MSELTDAELLLEASRGSRDALEGIARRYVGFVYNAALRQTHGDKHLAEDVTQAVFVILSRKVHQMKRGTLLHGWLFTTTRYAAANAGKMRKRRIHHERVAAGMRREAVEPEPVEAVTPLLDEALADLREPERCAILLSYFGGKTYREVGAQIGTSEEGARKRVERAVNRMRDFFAKRGVAVSGAAVAATLKHSAGAALAPPGLLESILACMAAPTVSGASVGALAKGVIHMMTWTQLKIAGAMTAIVLTTLVAAGAAMLSHRSTAADEKTNAPPAAAVVELANDVTVELLGISTRPSSDKSWWNADGTPAAAPYHGSDDAAGQTGGDPADERDVVFRVTGPDIDDLGVRIELPDQRGWSSGRIDALEGGRRISFNALGKPTADLRITLATGPYQTLLTHQPTGLRSDRHIVFGPAVDEDGGCVVTTSDDLMDHQARVVAVGVDGQTHESSTHFLGITKGFRQMTTRLPLPTDEIDRFEFQARPFDQFVEFKNVSLLSGKNAGFTSQSGKVEPKVTDK